MYTFLGFAVKIVCSEGPMKSGKPISPFSKAMQFRLRHIVIHEL